ncbi:Crp/Fnr family transcriptional regulator [Calditerrivibrio nitroreducens]|uniref:Transcriptional regulator, Crp/Fnr family n=1 Tax=Calditerrivibrio nitroreducens (strain DSM 19672 / NBRC 101217 / Yu37-1) TaxID=768670 RepID=E4TF71_CALNY|nr:Crp/Fnr family transcriptional regulator [Calditerrivibrio nitroreducens]ADR18410.1 transcriptional regulator, Crp/Fnr family [Calditerrivibrio nitroreducens DSM 19672]
MKKIDAIRIFCKTFLGGMDEELCSMMESVTSVVTKKKGEIFFIEGEYGTNVFFLISGLIKLYKTNDEGKEAIIHFVKSGEIFAEILFFLQNRYPVTSVALEDCIALAIDSKKIEELISKKPKFAMKLIGALSKRIKYLINMLENLTLSDLSTRFLNYLKTLSEQKKSDEIILPVKKGDLAILLGATPEAFSRMLKKLKDDGIIGVEGKKITLFRKI